MNNSINLQEIADNLGFDLSDVEMLLNMFIEATNESLDNLSNAIVANNYSDISAHAHAIKGSAANIMLNDITSIAEQIELNANKGIDIDYTTKCNELKQLVDSLI